MLVLARLPQTVAQEVHRAALPWGAAEHSSDRRLETRVRVGNDELHSDQAASDKTAEKRLNRPGWCGDFWSWRSRTGVHAYGEERWEADDQAVFG